MEHCVIRFRDVTSAHQASAGGKGGMLARMLQAGYPVPDGFVILPAAFREDELASEAWELVAESLRTLRRHQPSAPVAVRSSALSEDSDAASFAGEFESVLNVRTEEEVREAIAAVRHSGQSERVQAYSRHQGMTEAHQVAIVVQLMVPAAIAGVLFTADPITGSHARMSGNFVHGLGERLVSGEADAQPFSFERPKGVYTGPEELKPFAKKLYALAARLERELKKPQDIEWATADGKLFILQARPVTTLRTGNPDTYEWNDSLDGDFLWTNTNVGEAMSDVFTPLSWSMIRKLDEEQSVLPGYYCSPATSSDAPIPISVWAFPCIRPSAKK